MRTAYLPAHTLTTTKKKLTRSGSGSGDKVITKREVTPISIKFKMGGGWKRGRTEEGGGKDAKKKRKWREESERNGKAKGLVVVCCSVVVVVVLVATAELKECRRLECSRNYSHKVVARRLFLSDS